MNNGFRGSSLPAARRVPTTTFARAGTASGAPIRGATAGPTNESVLAEYLAMFGPNELNLVVLNQGGRSETDRHLANLIDLLDLVTLRTSHGREPSTLNKELVPGLFMSPTIVQEAIGDYGIQSAVDSLTEGLPTLGPRSLAPVEGDARSPCMWVLSAGDPRLGETLYAAVDQLYRPHRHMWSHTELPDETLRWAIFYQLHDAEVDAIFPDLRHQPGYATFDQRANRALDRLTPQTGNTTHR